MRALILISVDISIGAQGIAAQRQIPHCEVGIFAYGSQYGMKLGFLVSKQKGLSFWTAHAEKSDSSNRCKDQESHHHHAASQCQTHPFFVMQIPVRQTIQSWARRSSDEDHHQGQDKDQIVEGEIAITE